jgi:hypothetical protein
MSLFKKETIITFFKYRFINMHTIFVQKLTFPTDIRTSLPVFMKSVVCIHPYHITLFLATCSFLNHFIKSCHQMTNITPEFSILGNVNYLIPQFLTQFIYLCRFQFLEYTPFGNFAFLNIMVFAIHIKYDSYKIF